MLGKMLNTRPMTTPNEVATQIAANLQSGDEEWTYIVEPFTKELSRIAIYDEDGEFVGYWTE